MIVRAKTTDGGRVAFWSQDMVCVQDVPAHTLLTGTEMPRYINVCFSRQSGMPMALALEYSDGLYDLLVSELEGQAR